MTNNNSEIIKTYSIADLYPRSLKYLTNSLQSMVRKRLWLKKSDRYGAGYILRHSTGAKCWIRSPC